MRVFILMLLCSVMLSCCKEAPKKYNSPSSKKQTEVKKEASICDSNENFICNVDGKIIDTHEDSYKGDYFFTIELEDGSVFDWEVNRAKFSQKKKGDAVHFEYLRKDRFSDKAMN